MQREQLCAFIEASPPYTWIDDFIRETALYSRDIQAEPPCWSQEVAKHLEQAAGILTQLLAAFLLQEESLCFSFVPFSD